MKCIYLSSALEGDFISVVQQGTLIRRVGLAALRAFSLEVKNVRRHRSGVPSTGDQPMGQFVAF